jgi:hypothetical protein
MVREVKNYEGRHIGMLGTSNDSRFPYRITMYNSKGNVVAQGCAAAPEYQGCVVAWGIMFYNDVKKSEINNEGMIC